MKPLPRAARPLFSFAALLRANGFPIAPEQTIAFLDAVRLLGPRSIHDIRRAALALFAVPPEDRDCFDALFGAHFLGARGIFETETEQTDDDSVETRDEGRGEQDVLLSDEVNESGATATTAEVLAARRIAPADPAASLRRLRREAPARLPRRRSLRLRAARRGRAIDLRRALKESVRTDGDAFRLFRRRPRTRQRRVLLLIDVSGSMKTRTDENLRFAHALARSVEAIEVFTFGTRLTRITRAMRLRGTPQALDAAANAVADFDGGTRIGEALQAFLAVPRFAGYARGAVVFVLSDGLERGDPAAMVDAFRRFRRRAWRLVLLSPLAADPDYRPETAGLKAALPYLDRIAPAHATPALVEAVLATGSRAA